MSITACEELATKAELEELRSQIIGLLGQTAGGGSPINVLQQGHLGGTAIADRLIEDVEFIEEPETGVIKLNFIKGSPGSDTGSRLAQIASQGVKAYIERNKRELELYRKIGKASWGFIKAKNKWGKIQDTVNRALVDTIDEHELARQAEIKLRKFYSQIENPLQILNEVGGNPEVIERTITIEKGIVERTKVETTEVRERVIVQQADLEELKQSDYLQGNEIARLTEEVVQVREELETSDVFNERERNLLKEQVDDIFRQLQEESERRELVEETLQEYGRRLSKTEGDLAEAVDRFEKLLEDQDELITRTRELLLPPGTDPNEAVTQIFPGDLAGRVYGRGGGGGIPVAAGEAIANNQKATMEAFWKLLGSPETVLNPTTNEEIAVNPDITYPDIVNRQSTFPKTMEAFGGMLGDLNPTLNPQMTPEQLDEFGSNLRKNIDLDIKNTIDQAINNSIIPVMNDINERVSQDNIRKASSEAICRSTEPGGCMKTNMFDPLNNAVKSLGDNIDTWLGAINTVLNNAILAKLNGLQDFLFKAWKSTGIDKTLNAVNTIVSLHNAAMLSRNLGVTIGETISLGLNALPITAFDETEIDVNEWIGDRFDAFAEDTLGAEEYKALKTVFASANRMIVASQGMLSAMRGVKDAIQEGQEIIVNRVGTLGNTFLEQGIFESGTYPWMNEETSLITPFQGFTHRIQGITEFVEEVNQLIQTGIEVQENFQELSEDAGELSESKQKLAQALAEFTEAKEEEEQAKTENSLSPDIALTDLVKGETEGN